MLVQPFWPYLISEKEAKSTNDKISKAATKLTHLDDFIGWLPERDTATPYERVILQTFEAIYGKVLWDSTEPNHKANNEAGRERVNHVLSKCSRDVE